MSEQSSMGRNLTKLLMASEAFFGNFYIAVTRGLFVPMLTYSGYSLDKVSQVSFFAALMNVIISYLIYNNPDMFSRNVRLKLLSIHASERVLFALLPFLIGSPDALVLVYSVALTVTIPVNVLLNVALMSVFVLDEFVEINVLRSAVGAAASLLGSLYSMVLTAFLEPPTSYYVAYVSSSLIGLMATLSLAYYTMPADFTSLSKTTREEAEIRKVNTFLMLVMMIGGGNLIGLAWPQLLKSLDTPLYVTILLNVAGNVGGVIGPYLWKGYRGYVLAMTFNILFTSSIPLLRHPWMHVGVSAALSATFIGANLIASSIYSRYVESLGVVKASTFLSASNGVGLFIASVLGKYLPGSPPLIFSVATMLKFLGLLVVALAIPETSIVPPRTAYGYGKLIYSASMLGYTFTVETSRKILKVFIQIIALAFLLTLILLIYELLAVLSSA
ncbi:MAG: hypothetical protein QXX81_02365 [Zestosphaera sp.]